MRLPEPLQERAQRIGAQYHKSTLEVLEHALALAEQVAAQRDAVDLATEILEVDYQRHLGRRVTLFTAEELAGVH